MMSQEQETAMLDQPDPGCRPVVYRGENAWWWECDEHYSSAPFTTMQSAFTDAHHHATRGRRDG